MEKGLNHSSHTFLETNQSSTSIIGIRKGAGHVIEEIRPCFSHTNEVSLYAWKEKQEHNLSISSIEEIL